jgi:hypothetical protein
MSELSLHRYWFTFELKPKEFYLPGVGLGCGVTAYGYDDALHLLQNQVFGNRPIPIILNYIEDVDVSTLDPGHVLPNLIPCNWRGVWFPPRAEWYNSDH